MATKDEVNAVFANILAPDQVRIIEDFLMVDHVEDWSRVRSPGRARRRRQKYPQNIRIVTVPKKEAISIDGGRTIVMHPECARGLRESMALQMDRIVEKTIIGDLAPLAATPPLTVDEMVRSFRGLNIPVQRRDPYSILNCTLT